MHGYHLVIILLIFMISIFHSIIRHRNNFSFDYFNKKTARAILLLIINKYRKNINYHNNS